MTDEKCPLCGSTIPTMSTFCPVCLHRCNDNQIALRKIEQVADDIEQWIYKEVFDCQDNYLPKKIVENIKLILKQQEEE